MKIKLLLFSLLVSTSAQAAELCGFTDRGNELKAFSELLVQSCQAYETLCTEVPGSSSCPAKKITDNSMSPTADPANLENQFTDSLIRLNNDLYAAENKGMYLKKLQLLDEESRHPNDFRMKLITHVVLQATAEWINIYGDPFRNMNLTGETDPKAMRTQENAASKAQVAAGAGTVATLAILMFVTRTKSPVQAAEILSFGPRILAKLRMSIPPGALILTQAGISEAAPVATGIAAGVSGNPSVPPSPAHIVRFNELIDADLVTADMIAAFDNREYDMWRKIFGWTGQTGFTILVSEVGIRNGAQISSILIKSATYIAEDAKFLRAIRITPAGIVIGFAVSELIKWAVFEYQLNQAQKKLAVANDQAKVYQALNEIYHTVMGKAHYGRRAIEIFKHLQAYGSAPLDVDYATQQVLRGNLIADFKQENYPDMTGAHWINGAICMDIQWASEIAAAPANPNFRAPFARDKAESIRIYQSYKANWINSSAGRIASDFSKHVKKWLKKLDEYDEEIANLELKYPNARRMIVERRISIHRWKHMGNEFLVQFEPPYTKWDRLVRPLETPPPMNAKVQGYLKRIIELEAENPDFSSNFRCNRDYKVPWHAN